MSIIYNGIFSTLPELTIPDFEEYASGVRDYVYFGADNQLPVYIANLITLSPTHAAIFDSKKTFVNGDLQIEITKGKQYLDFDDIDTEGLSLEELIDDTSGDAAMFETIYWEVMFNSARTRIVGINRLNYEDVRVGLYNEEGKIDTVYVSSNWNKKYLKKHKPRPLAVFDPKNVDTDTAVIIERIKRPNQKYYTVPLYMSAVQYILLEDDVASLNRNDVTNGFFPSMIMNFFNGEPTEDDKANLETYVRGKFKGVHGQKLMMFFGTDPAKKVQLDTFEPPNLGEYTERMLPMFRDMIISAHRTYPSLAGLKTNSGFSSKADEIDTEFQMFLKGSVVPLQKLMIRALKKILKFNKTEADIMFVNELLIESGSTEDVKDDKANASVNDKKNTVNSTKKGGTSDGNE
jgi:hypothetical protein